MTAGRIAILAAGRRMVARLIRQMATVATAKHLRVIHARNRIPRAGTVAGIASIGRIWMRQRLAVRLGAVMAAIATAGNLRVIHLGHGVPRGRVMAGLAGIGARNMRRRFSGGGRAVVATRATSYYSTVIEVRWCPRGSGMT